jgi:hypothetical protein
MIVTTKHRIAKGIGVHNSFFFSSGSVLIASRSDESMAPMKKIEPINAIRRLLSVPDKAELPPSVTNFQIIPGALGIVKDKMSHLEIDTNKILPQGRKVEDIIRRDTMTEII